MNDSVYLARAIALAKQGLYTTDPNPRVGCVVVKSGQIVGEGWHQQVGGPHAEINALAQAGNNAQGATCYVTLEPCCHHGRTAPCTGVLIQAGINRVVVAIKDPNPKVAGKGLAQLRAAGIEVTHGLLTEEAKALNLGFIQRFTLNRPWVRCKLAMSLDGATALASGESRWITSPAARHDVQKWRARSSGILTGIGTILHDNPSLNVRYHELKEQIPELLQRQPLCIILDQKLTLPEHAKILSLPRSVLVVCEDSSYPKAEILRNLGVEVINIPLLGQKLDLALLMTVLAQREMNELHVECGAKLAGSLLQAGLIDELILYIAPKLMGDNSLGLFHLLGINTMKDTIDVVIKEVRAIGNDWRFIVHFNKS
ncbi:bifunctional diaminohydroxyphosphoribosylaminopyrimidine deaminase/5-amino-6-(5-phosphoribosylamino)uracil reductase RibD [Candidatus Nitrosacidococcus tergens]|uniref:Riboflavin biosynthesis protein RibD n=1 Tax=Candidatus Nitrosacidococcus tergens TaxID=553981 RepID=A0A7G1Q8E5_9GAMM|nr:bifunctional diaminohydroxyphosphoribosylaminopyrimidine deaminase/5-amino-6-(5-phosphoribosylamino)uracil reductase RibD [Candidatus Nitrosacidococcus tergens]CAB1274950.1 Riboflavin biosynthesis protein RibD [Includes: Diaminohydroxyphosphoribosylaminopyrimidine deaminase; 5-amino-6-(5-phosphoribosylamino)uracil reductase] [Candidatus Nitrosacidococcus tergens]